MNNTNDMNGTDKKNQDKTSIAMKAAMLGTAALAGAATAAILSKEENRKKVGEVAGKVKEKGKEMVDKMKKQGEENKNEGIQKLDEIKNDLGEL